MKKVILIGATLLVVSSAFLIANNNSSSNDCKECPAGICKPGDKCDSPEECCKK